MFMETLASNPRSKAINIAFPLSWGSVFLRDLIGIKEYRDSLNSIITRVL